MLGDFYFLSICKKLYFSTIGCSHKSFQQMKRVLQLSDYIKMLLTALGAYFSAWIIG